MGVTEGVGRKSRVWEGREAKRYGGSSDVRVRVPGCARWW